MARENIVLSLNPDGQKLHGQESVLRENGFEIISAATPLQGKCQRKHKVDTLNLQPA
jgi:hypothetical protein